MPSSRENGEDEMKPDVSLNDLMSWVKDGEKMPETKHPEASTDDDLFDDEKKHPTKAEDKPPGR